MSMETDPDKINDPDRNDFERQMESRLLESGNAYSASHRRSREENKVRANNRAKIKEMGMRTDAYQVGVRIVKDLTENERKDFLRDLNAVVKVLGSRQQELFPEEAMKAAKREERKNAKVKGNEGAPNPDENPRNDPASGGAGRPSEEELTKAAAAAEQTAGEDALAAGLPKTRKAQSAQAAEKLAAAKLSGMN